MSDDPAPDSFDLVKVRLDYAWKYFDSASNRRMQFINYYFIVVGILANALALCLRDKLYPVAVFVGIFGLVSSMAFYALDHRMLAFVNRAQKVLETIERETLFPDGYSHRGKVPSAQLGLCRIEPDRAAVGAADRETGHLLTKVWLWIGIVQGLAGIGFLLAIVYTIRLWWLAPQ
jgi:hypothetical protein